MMRYRISKNSKIAATTFIIVVPMAQQSPSAPTRVLGRLCWRLRWRDDLATISAPIVVFDGVDHDRSVAVLDCNVHGASDQVLVSVKHRDGGIVTIDVSSVKREAEDATR